MAAPQSPLAALLALLARRLSLCVLAIALASCQPAVIPPEEIQAQCEAAITDQKWDQASQLADQITAESDLGIEVRFDLAEAATKAQKYEVALAAYQAVRSQTFDEENAARAALYSAEIERELGRLSLAESGYREALLTLPNDKAIHERLAFLLCITGRGFEAIPSSLIQIRFGQATFSQMAFLGDADREFNELKFLEQCQRQAPDDPIVALGLAANEFWEGEAARCEAHLRSLAKNNPQEPAIQAMLGDLLLTGDPEKFNAWHQALPVGMDHPQIWYVRGVWARRHEQLPVAAHCFWQALRRFPVDRRSMTQLSQVLIKLNHPAAPDFERRAAQMSRITQLVDAVLKSEGQDEGAIRDIAQALEETGRYWEACGWGIVAQKNFPQATWPGEIYARRTPLLNDQFPQVDEAQNLALKYDLSTFPGFDTLLAPSKPASLIAAEGPTVTPRFEEVLNAIPFEYFGSPDLETPGTRSFEQTGGGVSVIDYDRDGTPDLFFPQGKQWLTGSSQPTPHATPRDTLARHSVDGRYRSVTDLALPADLGFGQGSAAGDFDNDGFPDLYVANVGRNQLLHNLGDGTFEDVTDLAGLALTDWTASTVIADMNNDGFPDLFDVNYLSGPLVYEALCQGHGCSPKVFEGTPARLHLSHGDGTFQTAPYGPDVRPGKGLGAICLPLASAKYPDLFISNDQVANQLLKNHPLATGTGIELVDEAMTCGTAYGENGSAMAGMGIAADDVDGNGLTDFFVTNFKDEPNTLYLQDSPGLFVDATRAYRLKAASLEMVGWGTQFIDADRDSLPDLVVTNGHVDDYRDEGGEFEMRSQFFRQQRGGHFEELRGLQVGPFFDQKRRGRGLAKLDWNQDGLVDFAISTIGTPACLVSNTTPGSGHFINIRLIATTTARDATGARVTVTINDSQKWTKLQLAGDGFMATNEHLLQFGLGPHREVKELLVEWPSGVEFRMAKPSVDGTLLIVEGLAQALTDGAAK